MRIFEVFPVLKVFHGNELEEETFVFKKNI